MLTRRSFIETSILSLFAFSFSDLFLRSTFAQELKPINPATSADPMVKAVGYVADNTKVDLAKFPKRKEPKVQSCANCQFYTATPKNKGHGKCSLIHSGLVAEKGWCNSWALKAS